MKGKTINTLLILLLMLFSQPLIFGQTLVQHDGQYITLTLRDDDLTVITEENMTRWLGHLDYAYEVLQELTGHTPYNYAPYNGRLEVRSVDYYPGGWAVAGNPVLWHQWYVKGELERINNDDDWSWGIVHEISHDFDKANWTFHAEANSTFKQLYVCDRANNAWGMRERLHAETQTASDVQDSADDFIYYGVLNPKVEGILLNLQKSLGWEPFKTAYRLMATAPENATNCEKFLTFLQKLDESTPLDVFSLITQEDLQKQLHYFDKGSLGTHSDHSFTEKSNLRAWKYTGERMLNLKWVDYFNNEDGYQIEYKQTLSGNYQLLATVGRNVNEYRSLNISNPVGYTFRIRAFNTSQYSPFTGYSWYSNEAVLTECERNNVSFKKEVTGGGTDTATYDLANAVDGSSNTSCTIVSDGSPCWLNVDLGGLEAVDRFIIKHAGATPGSVENLSNFKIQGSFDDSQWTDLASVVANTDNRTEIALTTATVARYLRLYITKPRQDAGYSAQIAEFEIYRSLKAAIYNVALNKTVSADGSLSNELPAKAVDGMLENNSKWCVIGTGPHWLQVDLGQNVPINAFIIKHAGVQESADYNTAAYQIQTSLDGVNWISRATVTNNTSNVTMHLFPLSLPVRYARLTITKAAQNPQETTARIYEFEALMFTANISLNKPTAADTALPWEGTEKAVDGLVANNSKWCALGNNPHWVNVDLGQATKIDAFHIKHAGVDEGELYTTSDYQILTSMDGVSWTPNVTVANNAANETYHLAQYATNARYVRLYITKGSHESGNNTVRIYEFQVLIATINFAVNKPVTADNNVYGEEPAKAVDSNFDTKWCMIFSDPHWLKVDLGQSTEINAFFIRHAGIKETPMYNTRDFQIQTSPDGTNWYTVVSVTGNTQSETLHILPAAANVRYVRLYITKGSNEPGDNTARIFEFQALRRVNLAILP